MPSFETTGGVFIGTRRAQGPFVKLTVDASTLSITSPIASIALGPREVIDLRASRWSRRLEIVHTRDRRSVAFVRGDPEDLRAQILATGFRPSGVPGGGPDPARAAQHAEEDRANRRKLFIFGAVIVGIFVVVFGGLFLALSFGFTHSEAYERSLALVQSDARVIAVTGTPVVAGTPSGSIATNGESGQAALAYSVTGPRGRAQVHVQATKALGRWTIDGLAVDPDGDDTKRIELVVPKGGDERPVTL